MTAAAIYAAGSVRRYHANPRLAHLPQTNADHQGRCVQIALTILPRSMITANLLAALATHDVAERWVGDLPFDFKRSNPDVAAHHCGAETARLRLLGLGFDLTDSEAAIVKLIDMIEARAFVALHAPHVLQVDGWPDQRVEIERRAWKFGSEVAGPVVGFLDDLEAGRF